MYNDYDYDYSIFFTHNILLYKLLGFWRPDEDMKYKTLYICYTLICTTLWVTFVTSQVTYICINFQNVEEVTATLYVTLTFSIDLIKMITIYWNMNKIKSLIKNLNKPIFQVKCARHYKITTQTKKLNAILFYSCLYLGCQTDIVWSIVPLLGEERVTLARGWFPYDENKSVNYELTYIFQNMVSILNTMICLNLDTFTCALLIQVGLQCDLLCNTLEYLDEFHVVDGVLYENSYENKMAMVEDNEIFTRTMLENLKVCVKHHKEIMCMAKDIENIHKVSVFILFTGAALIICSCLFQLSMVTVGTSEFFMLLHYLVCMLTEQFVYCWFGNEVLYKSSKILESTYNTPWVDCDIKFRKVLLQFMTQAYRPISVKVGGLFTISISVFISVVKTAYSYYALLKKIE